jgi:hypothetical protein
MDAFATFEDVQTRYPAVSSDEQGRVTALLGDATALVAGELERAGIPYKDPSELTAAALKSVCCAMVVRALPANSSDGYVPYTQQQTTAGPFSQSFTLSNPNGELYLTRSERKRLGLGGGFRQFFVGVDVLGGDAE